MVYRNLGRLQESLRSGRAALKLLRGLEDPQAEAYVLSSLAESHEKLGHYPSALSYLKRSLRLRRKIGDREGEVGALYDLARIHENLGDMDRSGDASDEAISKREALEEGRKVISTRERRS